MGKLICEKHGGVIGILEVCAHVSSALDDGKYPDGHRFVIGSGLFLCNECYDGLDFQRFMAFDNFSVLEDEVTDEQEEEYFKAYEAIEGRHVVCRLCVDEIKQRYLASIA